MITRLAICAAALALALPGLAQAAGVPPRLPDKQLQRQLEVRDHTLSYSQLLEAAKQGIVQEAILYPSRAQVQATLNNGHVYTVDYLPMDTNLPARLAANKVQVEIDNSQQRGFPILRTIMTIIVLLLVGWMVAMMIVGRRGNPTKIAKLRKDVEAKNPPKVTFRDIAGCDEAVEEVSEVADYLGEPEKYHKLGVRAPRGIMLYGPPGTGKTLLAKALAGEAGVPFFSASGSEFIEMFVGVGAKRVRELFQRARASEDGAVVFIDEIDAVGRKRMQISASSGEGDQTLNQLLAEMDGFHERSRVIVIGATNRLDTLDDALLRPGRFDLKVQVSLPNAEGRLDILKIHARGKALGEVDLEALATMTAGCSGAQLAEILNQAGLLAAREGGDRIQQTHLDEGYLRVLMGPERKGAVLAEGEQEVIAYHEAGHALVSECCATQDNPQRVSIRQRGQAAGMAIYGQTDRALHSVQFFHEQLMAILGGRAAEAVQFATVTSGAANDLQQANAIARQAVEQLGLSAGVGQLTGGQQELSDGVRRRIDEEVERMLADAYRDAIALIEEHRDQLAALAERLLELKDLDRLEILAAIEGFTPSRAVPRDEAGPVSQPVLAPAVEPEIEPKAAPEPRSNPGLRRRLRAAVQALRAPRGDVAH